MSEAHTEAITEDQDMAGGGEEYNDEEYDEGNEDLFDDDDAEEEAEAVAKRLGDALWADISKAYAQQGSTQPVEVPEASARLPQPPTPRPPSTSLSEEGDDEETLVNAIQLVLDLAADLPSLHRALSNTTVPGIQEENLLNILTRASGAGTVAPELANTLGGLVQSIAEGELY